MTTSPTEPSVDNVAKRALPIMEGRWTTVRELEARLGVAPGTPWVTSWVEEARKLAYLDRNPDPKLADDEYQTTAKGRNLLRSRGSRLMHHPLAMRVGASVGGSVVGAFASAGAGGLFGASLVQLLDGEATDAESGIFGASVGLLLVSLFRGVEEMRRKRPLSSEANSHEGEFAEEKSA